MLTDFQGCEEQLVSEAQDGMRKHVVFESSSLANQQYDLQMLFKVRIFVEMMITTTMAMVMCVRWDHYVSYVPGVVFLLFILLKVDSGCYTHFSLDTVRRIIIYGCAAVLCAFTSAHPIPLSLPHTISLRSLARMHARTRTRLGDGCR